MDQVSVWTNTVFGWLVRQLFEPDLGALTLGCFGLLLIALGVRRSLARTRRLHELEYGMEDLRAANEAVRAALDDTKRQVAEATLAIAQKNEAREKKITGELQIIEGLIRDFASNATAKAKMPALPSPHSGDGVVAVKTTDPVMLEIIRRSLEENRVDLFLQPIVSLPQRKPRFYECFSRIRDEDGAMVVPEQYLDIAKREGLIGAIDNMLLFRGVQLVRRLQKANSDLGFF